MERYILCLYGATHYNLSDTLLNHMEPLFKFVFSQFAITYQELTNPLARRPGLVMSTFGLAEIISCMPDGLVKIYIGYWQTCQYSRIYLYSYMLYVV
jgi:hypothetical protein